MKKIYNCRHWPEYLKQEHLFEKAFIRGSGKGGQNRNKTSNAVQVRFWHIRAQASEERSLDLNLKRALRRLKIKIALDCTPNFEHRSHWTKEERAEKINHIFLVAENDLRYPQAIGCLVDLFLSLQCDWAELGKNLPFPSNQISKWFLENQPVKKHLLLLKKMLAQKNSPALEG